MSTRIPCTLRHLIQVEFGITRRNPQELQLQLVLMWMAKRNVSFAITTEANLNKTNDIKENFAALLRDSLRGRFGRIPSAAVVAREFNLRAYDTLPISQESARRWIRGVSLPEEQRLRVLVNWLNLDFNAALRPGRHLNGHGLNGFGSNGHFYQHGGTNGQHSHELSKASEPRQNGQQPTQNETEELAALVGALSAEQKKVLESFLKTAFKSQRPHL